MGAPIARLSVVIPAYNEEAIILATIDEVASALAGLDYEVIVVDDGSSDSTFQRVEQRARADDRVTAIRYESNRGKGYALKAGFAQATGDVIAFLDADLDLHPRQVADFLSVLQATQADAVIGSKLHPRSQIDYPLHRRVISHVYFWLIRLLFGLPVLDTQTGVKLFRRSVLSATLPRLTIDGFAFDLELLVLAHQHGFKIVDAPVTLTFKRGFWGRIGPAAVRQVLKDTWRVYLDTRSSSRRGKPPAP